MDSAAIAGAIATIFGGVTPPAGEPAIVLATHQLPDELKAAELPAILVWPPEETPVIQAGMDRSKLRFPVVLYLPRDSSTQARTARLYKWRDALRVQPQTSVTGSHLGLGHIADAGSTNVAVNDPADVLYGVVNYDTVRVDVGVTAYEPNRWIP